MPDMYIAIAEQPLEVQQRLSEVLETRAAEAQQRAMLEAYLARAGIPANARVLEIGCGTGPVTRVLATHPGVREVVGLDPSPVFLARARELAGTLTNVSYEQGDARAMPFPDSSFDVAVFHTTLCHVPDCEAAIAEACRVLEPGGRLAIFDGDYVTTTLATGEHDPLQACADAAIGALVHDRWLLRRLPQLVAQAGFRVLDTSSFGYTDTRAPQYLLSIVDRGADALVAQGRIGDALADALKAEARRRVDAGAFFGQITYGCLLADKPA